MGVRCAPRYSRVRKLDLPANSKVRAADRIYEPTAARPRARGARSGSLALSFAPSAQQAARAQTGSEQRDRRMTRPRTPSDSTTEREPSHRERIDSPRSQRPADLAPLADFSRSRARAKLRTASCVRTARVQQALPSSLCAIRNHAYKRSDEPDRLTCSRPLSHLRHPARGRQARCLRALVRRPGRLLAAVARTTKEFPAPAGVSSA
jgi:hypothetical protein